MNCFYHPGVAAVGICKSCSKGLCPECAVDLVKGLACKGRCENEVLSIIRMTEYSVAMTDPKRANMRGSQMSSGFIYIAFGVLFCSLAALVHDLVSLVFGLPFGLLFLIYGGLIIRRSRQLPK